MLYSSLTMQASGLRFWFTIRCSVKFKDTKNLMNVSNHCKRGVDWQKISALASLAQTDPLHNRLTPPTSVPFWRIPLNYAYNTK